METKRKQQKNKIKLNGWKWAFLTLLAIIIGTIIWFFTQLSPVIIGEPDLRVTDTKDEVMFQVSTKKMM